MKAKIRTCWGGVPETRIVDNLTGYLLKFEGNVHELISYSEGVVFKYAPYGEKNVAYGTINCKSNEIIIAAKSAKIIKEKRAKLPTHTVVKKYDYNSILEFGFYQIPSGW
jgi:hypothetical protein